MSPTSWAKPVCAHYDIYKCWLELTPWKSLGLCLLGFCHSSSALSKLKVTFLQILFVSINDMWMPNVGLREHSRLLGGLTQIGSWYEPRLVMVLQPWNSPLNGMLSPPGSPESLVGSVVPQVYSWPIFLVFLAENIWGKHFSTPAVAPLRGLSSLILPTGYFKY